MTDDAGRDDAGPAVDERPDAAADAASADDTPGADAPAEPNGTADGRSGAAKPADPEGPPPGLITVRGAAVGVGLLWLAAMAGFGALQASMYAYRFAPEYAVVALAAAALSLTAGYGSFSRFGLV